MDTHPGDVEALVDEVNRQRASLRHYEAMFSRFAQLYAQLDTWTPTTGDVGFDPHGFFVYTLWSRAGRRLYIGQSRNVLGRVGDHMSNPERGPSVARITFIKCRTKEAMDDLELKLIRDYQPDWNVVGKDFRLAGEAACREYEDAP